jgi:hypothetical protein
VSSQARPEPVPAGHHLFVDDVGQAAFQGTHGFHRRVPVVVCGGGVDLGGAVAGGK